MDALRYNKPVIIAIVLLLLVTAIVCTITGCRQAERVNYNISREADNFNVYRRIVVINVRDNNVLYTLTGFFSLNNSDHNELIVTSQIGDKDFRKDYIYLNEWTSYVVEQLDNTDVSPYSYELVIVPEMIGNYVNIKMDS